MNKTLIDKQTIENIKKDSNLLGSSGNVVYIPEQQRQLIFDGYSDDKFLHIISKKYKKDEALVALDRINWDFKDSITQYLSHKFHSYPARFIPQIPLAFISLFTKEGDVVFDPMCGCGTTLVEAFLNSRNLIGNDFNPLAVLISKVKTTLIPKSMFQHIEKKLHVINRYSDLVHHRVGERFDNLPNRLISKIFDKDVIIKLEAIKEIILELKDEGHDDLYDLGCVALSSTIWSLVENGNGLDVENTFIKKVQAMKKELLEMEAIIPNPPSACVMQGDARNLNMANETVDLIVTSPPYVNALDYYRTHMYNMLWLGMDFNLFRKHEIGGHSHFIMNRFRLLSEYLADMLRSMIEMNRVMKMGKLCAIVIGNSSLEYELIESHKYFVSSAKDIGFRHIKTFFRSIEKSKKYTSANIGQIDDEFIVVLEKISDSKINAKDDDSIAQEVKRQMESFKNQIIENPGTSIRGKKPTRDRLLKNVERISDAIANIQNDIKVKG
jgi:DNA modification methylase